MRPIWGAYFFVSKYMIMRNIATNQKNYFTQ